MKFLFAAVLAASVTGLPVAALAEFDGSRQPAGGALMSSFANEPSEGVLPLTTQRQVAGRPMISEKAGFSRMRPVWAVGRQ